MMYLEYIQFFSSILIFILCSAHLYSILKYVSDITRDYIPYILL